MDMNGFERLQGPAEGQAPIDLLRPGSEHHALVLQYLKERIDASERAMSNFYDRWAVNEKRTQAYIELPKYEEMLKEMNEKGKAPKVVSITVPYTFATINTIVTYLIQTFCGRKPIFQVGSNKKEEVEGARNMELMLQWNADSTRLVKHLYQYFTDGELYGVQILRTKWTVKRRKRTVWTFGPTKFLGVSIPGTEKQRKSREEKTVFEGSEVVSQDPFMFFPDPRVPMADVNTRGEFVAWRSFEGKHTLKIAEGDGQIKWVEAIPSIAPSSNVGNGLSARGIRAGGTPNPGQRPNSDADLKDFVQLDQGTFQIIPRDLKLGESTRPEIWIFSIGNYGQILQAEPLDADHGKHPVVVGEPYTMGYGFGNCGISDFLGPMQETISWFINSHIHNVRSALNNMFLVDPSMVEMGDLKNPEPGKLIRLKRAAFGRDVRTAVQQFQVQDITRAHVQDLAVIMRMGDSLSAVTDNIRGLQDSGSRRSATEARTSMEAAASRLASHAKLISAQSIVDLTEQMSINFQQNLSDEFFLEVVGSDGISAPIHIRPQSVAGDFYYPVNDGTLPLDRVAMLDVWKEIFLGISQDQQLRQSFNLPNMFEWVAELGGAKNISRFRMDVQPDNGAIQAGNGVPLGEAMNSLGPRQ